MRAVPGPLDAADVDQLVVTLKDGSVWIAEYDSAGQLLPVRELGSKVTASPHEAPEADKALAKGSGKISETAEEFLSSRPSPVDKYERAHDTHDIDYYDEEEDEEEEEDDTKHETGMSDSVFRSRLSSIMTDNKFDRHVRGRSRGKLDMKHLWKAKVGATNLFMQKQARKNKEYNVVLVVDESGSMTGHKMIRAADTATFLAEAFEGLNINLAIVGFNHYIMLHKGFDETVKDKALLNKTLRVGMSYGGGDNNDYDALAFSYKLFKGRPGKNMLIMLSDGEPAQSPELKEVLDNPKYLEDAIKRKQRWAIRPKDPMGKVHHFWADTSDPTSYEDRNKKRSFHHLVHSYGDVASLGIGLESDCWQIPNHINKDNLSELKPVLLEEIKKQIQRG